MKLTAKKTKGEKAMDRALSSFMEYQQQAEERWERQEERWKRECEMEEKRRKEDKEHELRLFEKLAEILKPRTDTPTAASTYQPYIQEYNYNSEY